MEKVLVDEVASVPAGRDAAALPARVQEALGELVDAAREGLLALSVGVGLGVVAELMEVEVVRHEALSDRAGWKTLSTGCRSGPGKLGQPEPGTAGEGGSSIAKGEPTKELAIEAAVLADGVPPIEFMGEPIIDGVNAVPLVKGDRGFGEVEADLLLLIGEGDRRRIAVVEVKVDANHAWYAAVENLRQVKLVLESPMRALFTQRQSDLSLPANLR